ncbi:MAG: aromatic ring-hydroxylating dioxygenase subunit alpha [Immundisolibacterales bacterium]|nr:aromatic ring-hydroxylating dioxygenase subunit alpha [Immundisolibacterales bacterium]
MIRPRTPDGSGAAPDARTWPSGFNEAPKWAVEDASVFELEIERIFEGPLWHVVGHVAELDAPGRFKTITLGRTPLILVHGTDGGIRAFHNSCAHRGTMVETRFRGHADGFECPYHRWLYGLDGRLERCPGENDFPVSFDRSRHGLATAHAATFAGIIFASLHDRPAPLQEWLGSIRDALKAAMGEDGRLRLLGYQKVEFEANWKVYIDDEGYHAPLLHRAFRILQWRGGEGSQRRDPNGHRITRTRSGARPDTRLLRDPELIAYRGGSCPRNKFADQETGSLLVTPWPLGAVMNHLDVINIRLANPVDPVRTEVHYAYFAHADDDPDMVRHRLRQSSNLIGPSGFISLEDGAVFARIQRALHSRPDTTRYVRGWSDDSDYDPYAVSQNDETTNTVWWEVYRRTMGFER